MRPYDGYSANVAITLLVRGLTLAVSHVGPSGLIIQDPCDEIGSCEGKLVIKINQSERKYQVFMPHGIPGSGKLVSYL
ncbi:MAG: hypothetical protein IT425_11340 [Pirellulales bacterium]|nr:hypothetical protein [Pirellulales bacterium]